MSFPIKTQMVWSYSIKRIWTVLSNTLLPSVQNSSDTVAEFNEPVLQTLRFVFCYRHLIQVIYRSQNKYSRRRRYFLKMCFLQAFISRTANCSAPDALRKCDGLIEMESELSLEYGNAKIWRWLQTTNIKEGFRRTIGRLRRASSQNHCHNPCRRR